MSACVGRHATPVPSERLSEGGKPVCFECYSAWGWIDPSRVVTSRRSVTRSTIDAGRSDAGWASAFNESQRNGG